MAIEETRRALFLDRDGVINQEYGYVYRPQDFKFKEGIFELCRAAQDLGHLLIVITNQAGIARGYYTESDFLRLTQWMVAEFAARDVVINRIYHCPFHPVHGVGKYKVDSPDRKPKPGMLLRAREEFDLDMRASMLVGDQVIDIQAGEAAGVGTRILLSENAADNSDGKSYSYHVARCLQDIQRAFFSEEGRYAPATLRNGNRHSESKGPW